MTGSASQLFRSRRRTLALVAAATLLLNEPVMAEPIASAAAVASDWNLLGSWALDCSLPSDHDRGARFIYRLADDGHLILARDFGDSSDTNDVHEARQEPDGALRLTVYFPAFRQTRIYTLAKDSDGGIRAISNRDSKGRYSIRNGRFTATGEATPKQMRCD